nr:ATP-grasp fold amidoligase family protein [uncultured Draconibacterium sp.]
MISRVIKQQLANSLSFLPDNLFCTITYYLKHKRIPNLKNPQGFNEKLLKLKLTVRENIQHVLVDKYAVRKYIKDTIGEEYLIPIIGIYNNEKEIDFKSLPNRFVLKITNGSQNNIICTNKEELDWDKILLKLKRWLGINYYKRTREWPYKDVPSKIIIEEFLNEPSGDLFDYKFWCFNGRPEFVQIDSARFGDHKRDFYDIDFNETLNFKITYPRSEHKHLRPENYDKMVKIAAELSNGFKYLRVDLYNIEGKIYFGEITFYPGNCNEPISPAYFENKIGQLLSI